MNRHIHRVHRIERCSLFVCALLSAAPTSVFSQSLEKDAVKVAVAASFSFSGEGASTTPASASIYLDGVEGVGSSMTVIGSAVRHGVFHMKPGKDYLLAITTSGVVLPGKGFSLQPPAGYRVYLDDIQRNTVNTSGSIVKARVETETFAAIGESSQLRPGRVVWTVGLGNLSNGKPAGVLSLRETDMSFLAGGLFYDNVSPEVENLLGQSPAQIYAPGCLVEIVPVSSTTFYVRFYLRTQVTGGGGGSPYTHTGDPYVQYFVESFSLPNASPPSAGARLTKTVNQGGMAREMWTEMWKKCPTGSSYYTIIDWVDKPTGSNSIDGKIFKIQTDDKTTIGVPDTNMPGYLLIQSEESRKYTAYSWGNELSSVTTGYGLDYKAFTYEPVQKLNLEANGNAWYGDLSGTVSTVVNYDGGWERRKFTDVGLPSLVQRPFAGAPASLPTSVTDGEVVTNQYVGDWTGSLVLPSRTTVAVNGVTTANSEISYSYENIVDRTLPTDATLVLQVATRKDYYDSSHYLTTVTKKFRDGVDSFFTGLPHSVKKPDGTMSVALYFRGTFNAATRLFTAAKGGPETMRLTLNGTSLASADSAPLTSFTLGDQTQPTETDFRIVPNVSTADAAVMAADATIICTQAQACVGTVSSYSWLITQRDVNFYTSQVLLARTSRDSGDPAATWDILVNSWTGGRLDWTTDESGVRTDFTYDVSGRVLAKTRAAASGAGTSIGALTTTYEYYGTGQVSKETISAAGISETLITTRTYDLAGRLVSEVAPGYTTAGSSTQSSRTTSYDYDVPNRKVTTTAPTGGSLIEQKFLEGRVVSRTGTAGVAEYYAYSVEADGRQKTLQTVASSADARKKEEWKDLIARSVKTSRPGFTGQPANEENSVYDDYTGSNTGRLVQTAKTGLAPTRYDYNAMSEVTRSGLDADGTAGLQTNSASDRIADAAQVFEYFDGAWWQTTTSSSYPFAGSATAKEMSRTRKRLTGLTASLRAETRNYDAEGNETRVTVAVDAVNKLVTTTTKRPGMAADQIDKSLNGLPIETTGHDGLTFKKRYDALGRLVGEIDPRTGSETNYSTKYTYHPNTTWVKEVKDAANKRLSFTHYDAAGRVVYTEDAFGKTTRTSYTARGEVENVWGTATYPVSYVYNNYGERVAMRTYRDPNGASLADTTTFPNLGTYDETTWEFDAPSGLLKKKTDAKGRFVEYTYNVRGQTAERFWSRTLPNSTTRVKATLAYYGDVAGEPATGELKSTSYNDGTPAVSYAYTRSAQADAVTDAVGSRDLIYDANRPWRLAAEALDTFYGSRVLTRTYDAATSANAGTLASHTLATVLGRTAGLQLGTASSPAAELEFSFPMSNAGRIAGVASARNSGAESRTFAYGYETNSALLKSLAIVGNHPFTVTRDFEASRDLLTNVEAKWSTATRTKYGYTYDDRRQRQSVVQAGDVFNDYGGPDGGAIHQIFTYNDRGEVTAAGTYLGATATDQSLPLSARKHEFSYDGIGNRKWSNTSGNATLRDNYTTNELNQYVSRENNTLAVGGTVADDANIKVAARLSGLAGRQGRHWGDNVALENSVAPFQGDLTIYAVNSVANTKMVTTRTAFIAPAAQAFSYDNDGNITSDGVWTYEWDAENRLWAMQTTANAIAGGVPAQRLEFKYDYLHRRVEKLVRGGWNGSAFTTVTSQRRYLYDGWSLIAEFAFNFQLSTFNLVRSYTWGLDIARSLADAGGVGALLQIADHTTGKTYLPSYDGNGNVTALFDADSSGGTCAAAYEYSPYGEFLRCEGSYAKENPFRFSTKFTDDETGLVYYGRRYYNPNHGRFVGRDTIAEEGGVNLYGFVSNNPNNLIDYLGMDEFDPANVVESRPFINRGVGIGSYYGNTIWTGTPVYSSIGYNANGVGSPSSPVSMGRPTPMKESQNSVRRSQSGTMITGIFIKDGKIDGVEVRYPGGRTEIIAIGSISIAAQYFIPPTTATPTVATGTAISTGGLSLAARIFVGALAFIFSPTSMGSEDVPRPTFDVTSLPPLTVVDAGGLAPVLQGQAGVNQAITDLITGGNVILGQQITLQAGGVTIRPDLLIQTPAGQLVFVEVKTGGATLSSNQVIGLTAAQLNGAVPVGDNAIAAGLSAGVPLGPTAILTITYPTITQPQQPPQSSPPTNTPPIR